MISCTTGIMMEYCDNFEFLIPFLYLCLHDGISLQNKSPPCSSTTASVVKQSTINIYKRVTSRGGRTMAEAMQKMSLGKRQEAVNHLLIRRAMDASNGLDPTKLAPERT